MTKAQWLDKGLAFSPIYYTLVTTEKQLEEKLRWLNVPRSSWPYFDKVGIGASIVQLEDGDGKSCAIVIVPPDKDGDGIDVASRIVHEATHLWRWIREAIGEKDPSSEFEAYAMENLTHTLFREYARQRAAA